MADHLLLRNVTDTDLQVFFENEQDPLSNHMAAFTVKDPADWAAFLSRWDKIRADLSLTAKTILVNGKVAGSVLVHSWFGDPEVSYWLGRQFWGRGVATYALSELLTLVLTRPLYARVVKDNMASLRVLEKCGFTVCGEDRGFANARGAEVEEFILVLAA